MASAIASNALQCAGLTAMARLAAAAFVFSTTCTAALADDAPTLSSPHTERWRVEWPNTDFTESAVDFDQIFDGGPPKDGIPAVTGPGFFYAKEVVTFSPREPVISLVVGEEARAYPIRYLMWHEIVNDMIQDIPVAITFCPLCSSGIVFDRRVGEQNLIFGVSGKLVNSNLVMYDRKTESWWQQFTGEAIVGKMTGEKLAVIPSTTVSWQSFRDAHPEGLVMAQPSRYGDRYGANPYVGYDGETWPMLFRGDRPPHNVPALARVVRVGKYAWPLTRLARDGEIIEAGVRLTWRPGQSSALDAPRIADGRDVGDVAVFDADTGAPVAHEVVFAFAFNAFYPFGNWMMGGN